MRPQNELMKPEDGDCVLRQGMKQDRHGDVCHAGHCNEEKEQRRH